MTATTLKGKVALVTGGTRGIGLETVRGLAELGATVIIGARDASAGAEAAASLKDKGYDAHSVKIDVNVAEDHEAVYRYIQQQFNKLDILINNAGILLDQDDISREVVNRSSTIPSDILRNTFDTNFFAPIALTQTLLPLIRQSDAGRIVNVSSILGSLALQANPASPVYGIKTFAYNASKTAINAFTVHLAAELRDTPIKVNSVHPGWVRTRLGGHAADMNEAEGAKTSIYAATLPEDGPTGAFLYGENTLPW
ncbi:SDR family oxidoreductase [Paenibacillus sp. NPDC058071]|uniref:SDR family oxidoreductase n=1 Tax=Paenibacillus sp. NPDC058071 TaxID=3346326 RepID=UPI0036DE9246